MSPKVNFYETDPIERGQVRLRPVRHGETAPVALGVRKPPVDKSARAREAARQISSRESLPLTARQRQVLNVLTDDPQRPRDVAKATGLNGSMVGSALRYLSSKGLAVRSNTGGWMRAAS